MTTWRILFVNRIAPYEMTGGCQVIWKLGESMAGRGWDVHYLSPRSKLPAPPNPFTLHTVSVPGSQYSATYPFLVAGIPKLAALVRDLRPAIVYDNCIPGPYPAAYAVARGRVVTRIHHIYSTDAFRTKRGIVNPSVTYLGERCFRFLDPSRTIIGSESARERLARIMPRASEVRVIPPGIDLGAVPARAPDLARDRATVVVVTRLAANKGLDTLLTAWRRVEAAIPDARLLIAGTGSEEARLKRLAAELGVRTVRFLGYVSDEEKWRLLQTCAVYAFPTLIEGLGISLLEAMATGAPILSTRSPGVMDALEDGVTGLLVPPGDADALFGGVVTLLAHEGMRTRLAAQAERVVGRWDLVRLHDEEIAFLGSVALGSQRR